jgi:SAM-dependent methyltransferase
LRTDDWRPDTESTTEFVTHLIRLENEALAEHDYVSFHARRFGYLVNLCRRLSPKSTSSVLDVGRSHLSSELATYYQRVVTLGLPLNNFAHERVATAAAEPTAHVIFDLNESAQKAIPIDEHFDLIVFAETMEHLHSAPEIALYALKKLLKPRGFLICQTPNAAALERRYHLLLGRNPFERIRYNPLNPGHFREYTRSELIDLGDTAGLRTVRHEFVDYFPHTGPLQIIRSILRRIVPTLRSGQTVVYARNEK